jgi:hypothetical protein
MSRVFQPNYMDIETMLEFLDSPNREGCLKMFNDNLKLFETAPGSSNNHQAWKGGYYDHVCEAMNCASLMYTLYDELRPLPFRVTSAFLVLFLHDIEKPWKYELNTDGEWDVIPNLVSKASQEEFRNIKIKDYGIVLTPQEENALKYVEGEKDDYTPRWRTMNELAAFCHMCDVMSARVWHSHPLEKDDPWRYSGRIRY